MADGPRYIHDDPSDTFTCRYRCLDVYLDLRGERQPYITLRFLDYEPPERKQTRFIFRSAEEIRQSDTTFHLKGVEVNVDELANLIDAILATVDRTTS